MWPCKPALTCAAQVKDAKRAASRCAKKWSAHCVSGCGNVTASLPMPCSQMPAANLQHGVDRSVIAMWLGHESMDTTQMYLHANIELKEKALAKTEPFRGQSRRYRPPDQLLAFLQAL